MGIVSKVLGAGQGKLVKKYGKRVNNINAMEDRIRSLTDEEIYSEIDEIRQAIENGVDPDLCIERAYALLREHIRRIDGRRAFDVQLIGAFALNDGNIIESKTGEGKPVATSTLIPTKNGWRKAGDIHVGDIIYGADGRETTVIGVYPQGTIDEYCLTFEDGRTVIAGENHLWGVHTAYTDKRYGTDAICTKTTRQMLDSGVRSNSSNGHRSYKFKVPLTKPVDYPEAQLPIPPYMMGAFLGDGCFSRYNALTVSSGTSFVPRKIADMISETLNCDIDIRQIEGTHSWNFYKVGTHTRIHAKDITGDPEIIELLVNTHSYDKHIPSQYLTASIEQRFELMQGLIDSDGHINKSNGYRVTYSTTSVALCDGFRELAWSLGFKTSYRTRTVEQQQHAKHTEYTVRIDCDNTMKKQLVTEPSRLEQAEAAYALGSQKQKRMDRMAITNIEKTGKQCEMVCFEVDAPDHLFLCGDYIVTHNTLVSHFPAFFRALQGIQTHVVTVNEYLARRDAEEMSEMMKPLGIGVGYIYNQQPQDSKREAYSNSIVYGTPSEFGFDYLRDNMVAKLEDKNQPSHQYAIIDEIDSILIDEARTPLIISGAGRENVDTYKAFAQVVPRLREGIDFEKDEGKKEISATEEGLRKVEKALGIDDLYGGEHAAEYPRHLKQALTAQFLYKRDKDYIVENGEVKIVDPNTGRVMEGRRWSEGLHQAIEAKEHVQIQQENETLATVTLQNYFRLYDTLSGMTGTAMTEDAEFRKTYDIGVVAIPTNKPMIRVDKPDLVYKDEPAKYDAVVKKIVELHKKGQPVLVGTVSVENSERLSRMLDKQGIPHETLNAKNHAKEAGIISLAGRVGAVTIATNMAGRGTDIMLGGDPAKMTRNALHQWAVENNPIDPETGERVLLVPENIREQMTKAIYADCKQQNEKVVSVGGLAVLGTERHESRRIDNQLRGRSGRQGDPGYSQFYVSLDDDLMRMYGGDKMTSIQHMMETANIPDDMPIESKMVTKGIERAQKNVEEMHYRQRKATLEYDDVLNRQRLAIYSERDMLLGEDDVTDKIRQMSVDVANDIANMYCDFSVPEEDWDYDKIRSAYCLVSGEESADWIEYGNGIEDITDLENAISDHLMSVYESKDEALADAPGLLNFVAKNIMLQSVDVAWREHLTYMDYLRSGINMRQYAQKDPLTEYKDEAYKAFEFMVESMYRDALQAILNTRIELQTEDRATPAMMAQDLRREHRVNAGKLKKVPTGGVPLSDNNSENKDNDVDDAEEFEISYEIIDDDESGVGDSEEINHQAKYDRSNAS